MTTDHYTINELAFLIRAICRIGVFGIDQNDDPITDPSGMLVPLNDTPGLPLLTNFIASLSTHLCLDPRKLPSPDQQTSMVLSGLLPLFTGLTAEEFAATVRDTQIPEPYATQMLSSLTAAIPAFTTGFYLGHCAATNLTTVRAAVGSMMTSVVKADRTTGTP